MKFNHIPVLILALLLAGAAQAGNKTHFKTRLAGEFEVPPVETETRGMAKFRFNKDLTYMYFTLVVREGVGVLGIAGAHLHCAPADANGPVVATLAGEVTSGFDGTLVIRAAMTDANIADDPTCGGNLANLAEAMLDGNVYVNVHSTDFPAGEVRGQVKGNMGKGDNKDDDDGG